MTIKSISKDIVIITTLALCMAIGSYLLSGWLNDQMQGMLVWVNDMWFDSDISQIYSIMSDRQNVDHDRSAKHPLFSIMSYPAMQVTTSIFGVSEPKALRLLIAISAALWIVCLYSVMRLIGCKKFDATVFSLLAATSATSTFWFAVPETFAMGSITILVSLAFIAITRFRKINWIWYVLLNIFTLSITVTNWMAGLTVTYIKLPFRKFIVTSILALTAVLCLWLIQTAIFPHAHELVLRENGFILSAPTVGVLKAIFAHSLIAPALLLRDGGHGLVLSFQRASLGSGSIYGAIALITWALLLGLSIWSFFVANIDRSFRQALVIILASQVLLHIIYGTETFLFSLHYLPLLIIFASLTTLTRYRKIALTLVLLLIPLASINNATQFKKSGICLGKLRLQTTLSDDERKMLKESPLGFDSEYKCGT